MRLKVLQLVLVGLTLAVWPKSRGNAQQYCDPSINPQSCVNCAAGRADVDSNPATICVACGAGFYSGGTATDCKLCPAGRAASQQASSTCQLCSAGQNASAGAKKCGDCNAGMADKDFDPATACDACVAGTFSVKKSTSCTQCVAGKQDSDQNPATACINCETGMAQPKTGEVECDSCIAGQYAGVGFAACQDCAKGYYDEDGSAKTKCTVCRVGYFADAPKGARYCTPCPSGTFAPKNKSIVCTACPVGSFSAPGSSKCTACQAGWADVDANPATDCVMCAEGRYAGPSSANCTACRAGLYDDDRSAATPCINCTAGTISSARQTECTACTVGHYSTRGSDRCEDCAGGKLSGKGASTCTNCSVGQFSPVAASVCTNCAQGQLDDDASPATNCTSCWPGTFSAAKASTCTDCAVGLRDHDKNAATACEACSPGFYNSIPGKTSCTACPPGRAVSVQRSASVAQCIECLEHTFALSGSSTCSGCPDDLNRDQTFLVKINDTMQPSLGAQSMGSCVCNPGTFASKAHVKIDWECFECRNRPACLGGDQTFRRGRCAVGYSGQYCATCMDGYFVYNEQCMKCPGDAAMRIVLFLGGLTLFAFGMIKVSSALSVAKDKTLRYMVSPVIILVARGQQLSAITNIKVRWPDFFQEASYVVLHFASVDLPSVVYPECQFNFKLAREVIQFRVVFNALLFIFVCLYIFAMFIFYTCQAKNYASLINGLVASFLMLYILLIQIGFKTFDCTHMDTWRMDLNPEVMCFHRDWQSIFIVGLAMLVMYGVLTPYAIWKQLQCGDLQDEEMLCKFGWVYGRYRPACYYFEYVIMAEKVAVAAATTFLTNANRAIFSLPLMLMITVASLVMQLKMLPFEEPPEPPEEKQEEDLHGLSVNVKKHTSVEICMKIREHMKQRAQTLTLLFRSMDNDGNAELDDGEISKALSVLGLHLTPAELDSFMDFIDNDGDGKVSIQEMEDALDRAEMENRKEAWNVAEVRRQTNQEGADSRKNTRFHSNTPSFREKLDANLNDWSGVDCGLIVKRWLVALWHPLSINNLEALGLTMQIVVIVAGVICGIVDDKDSRTSFTAAVVTTGFMSYFVLCMFGTMLKILCTKRHIQEESTDMQTFLDYQAGGLTEVDTSDLRLDDIDLDATYDLSRTMRKRYTSELTRLLEADQRSTVFGYRRHSLMSPEDLQRLSWLRVRLMHSSIIREERFQLRASRNALHTGKAAPIRRRVLRMIFILQFISKLYGPVKHAHAQVEDKIATILVGGSKSPRKGKSLRTFQAASTLIMAGMSVAMPEEIGLGSPKSGGWVDGSGSPGDARDSKRRKKKRKKTPQQELKKIQARKQRKEDKERRRDSKLLEEAESQRMSHGHAAHAISVARSAARMRGLALGGATLRGVARIDSEPQENLGKSDETRLEESA